MPPATSVSAGVGFGVFVAVRAVSPPAVPSEGHATSGTCTTRVFRAAYRVEVPRVNAGRIETQVVDGEPVWNRADEHLERVPVREDGATVSGTESSIPTAVLGGGPFPASAESRHVLGHWAERIDLVPEPATGRPNLVGASLHLAASAGFQFRSGCEHPQPPPGDTIHSDPSPSSSVQRARVPSVNRAPTPRFCFTGPVPAAASVGPEPVTTHTSTRSSSAHTFAIVNTSPAAVCTATGNIERPTAAKHTDSHKPLSGALRN